MPLQTCRWPASRSPSRLGGWGTATPGCDAPARSGAAVGGWPAAAAAAAAAGDRDCPWRRGCAPARARIDVADLQAQPFTKPQAQAVEGEEEHLVAEDVGGGEDPPGQVVGDDVGQALRLRRLD